MTSDDPSDADGPVPEDAPEDDEPVPAEEPGVRVEALLPKRTYDELEEWGQEIGCGAGFVLWAVVADSVHQRAETMRPRVRAAWEEAQRHGYEADE